MNGAVADALAAAGIINASAISSSSNVSAGVSFPIVPNAPINTTRPPAAWTSVSCPCCGSTFASIMAKTVGAFYRAFSGIVDPWTQQVLIDQEAQGLIKAGINPTQACAKANLDVGQNSASPVKPFDPTWVIVGVAVFAILIIAVSRR
jgi:hypothetical protein